MNSSVMKFLTLGAALCGLSAWAGVAKIGETEYETLDQALAAAQEGETIEIVQAGDYAKQTLSVAKNCTIHATVGGVKFVHTAGYGAWVASCENVTVKNVTWEVGNQSYQYFKGVKAYDCTFSGLLCTHQGAQFHNCTFYQSQREYCLWVYDGDVVFEGCIFNTQGKALNVYNEGNGPHEITIANCTFNNPQGSVYKPAILVKSMCGAKELEYTLNISGCEVVGNWPSAESLYADGKIQNNGLWDVEGVGPKIATTVDNKLVWQNGAAVSLPDPVEATVPSSNIMAVKRVPGACKDEVVAAVPWKALDGTSDITPEKLIATGVAAGDEIAVWDAEHRVYRTWCYTGTAWEAATDAQTLDQDPPADVATLARGQAVWYKRSMKDAAYSQIGGFASSGVTTPTVAGGATTGNKPVNNLLINPFYKDVDLAKIGGADEDQIQVLPSQKVYTRKNGKWGEYRLVETTTPFGGSTKRQRHVPLDTIPLAAGNGFWYISKGGAPEIDWKAIAADASGGE